MTKRAQLPDGTILEFPDETPDAVMDRAVKSHLTQSRQPTSEEIARQTFDESPWFAKPFIAAGAELTQLGRGAAQFVTPNDSEIHKRLTAAADADAPYQSGIHGVSGFVGRALPYLATLPLGGPEAAVLSRAPRAGALARAGIKAGVSAAEGSAYGALGEVRSGESRGEHAGIGALAGAAGRGVAGGLTKGAQFVRGRWIDPELQAMHDYLRKQGIPVTLGDLGSNASRWIENRLHPMLLSGRREVLDQQAQGIEREAGKLADAFTSQRQAAADRAGLGDASPEELVAGGIRRQYQANRKRTSELFDRVSRLAQGAPPVRASATQQALQAVEAEAPEALRGFTTSNGAVLDWLKLGGRPDMTFDELRAVRSEIGNAASAAERRVHSGNADKGTQNEARLLGQIKSAIESDLDNWAQQSGGNVLEAYRFANRFFGENVAPYRSRPETRPFIKPDANPDTIGNRLVANRPETAARIMAATDEPGRAAAKDLFVRRALDRATDPARENLSVFQLLSGLNPGKSADAIFTKPEQQALGKVTELAKLLSRASTAKSDPLTGQMMLGFGAQGTLGALAGSYASDDRMTGGLLGLMAGLAGPRAVNRATQSALIKRMVMTGTPKDVAEKTTSKLAKLFAQRAGTPAAIQQERPPLELDIAGGSLATPADLARDRALVEASRLNRP